ncbi:unnamed protein product [Brassica rapa subsp. narinosa]
MCRPSQTPHLTMSSARIDPPKRVLGLKEGVVTPPPIHGVIGLESSSTGSSFPADSAKPVTLAVVSLDSRQGHRIPLVRTSSELAVRRPGKAPERAVPSPSPGRHEAVRSRHVSSSSSPPTVDGFGTGTPEPSPQSQSFSRSCGSILPTSLAYIVPSTRGCSPWRPDAVMSTTGRERQSVLRIFKGRRECTGHHATCGALPAAGPYLRLSRFQDVPPQPNSPPDNVLRPDRPAEASLGSKRRGCYPASDSRSNSTGSSFPADSAKPVPLAVVSLDSRQGHRIPLVRTSSELAVRRPGKAPERAIPSPSPGRHEAVRSRHVSSSSSPPTVDGGCSPWRPDAVMSATGREQHSVLRIFKGRRECTRHHATCGALPAAGPYLRLSRFQGMLTLEPFSEDQTGRMGSPQADALSTQMPRHAVRRVLQTTIKAATSPREELGPGPSLRTLLQTTIRTPKTSDFQAGLFPSFWTGTSDYMTRIKFTTACQDAPDVLSLDLGQPRAVTHGRSASVPYPREDGGTTICYTQADVPSARRLGAQLAFKDSMVHGILQFTPSIAFCYVLHRCESRDIRCRESF